MRFYLAKCRDCDFSKTSRNGGKAENMAKSHEGESNHYVSVRGPFYEARGSEKWECELCDYSNTVAEKVQNHVLDEHEVAGKFIKKTGVEQ